MSNFSFNRFLFPPFNSIDLFYAILAIFIEAKCVSKMCLYWWRSCNWTPCFGFWKAFFNWFLLMEWARSDRFCIIFGIKLTTVQLAYLCHTYFLCGSNRHRNSTLYVDTILFCSPSLLYYFRSSELNFSFFISWSAKDWIQHSWMGGWCRFDFLNFQKNWGIHYSTAYREPAGIKKAELGNKRVVQCTQLLCRQFRWKHLLHPWVPPKK